MPPRKVHIKQIDGHMNPQIEKATKFTKGVGRAVKITSRRIEQLKRLGR